MKRFLAVFLMLAILLTVTANAATTGWKKEGNVWTYVKADGTQATDEWIKDGGKWYYFIGTAMAQDQIFLDGSKWYAADASGAMIANLWFNDVYTYSGETYSDWYYAGADGALVRGWKKIDGKWYFFANWYEEEAPFMVGGDWIYDEDYKQYYAFKPNGEMIVGWGQPLLGSKYWDQTDKDWVTSWVYGNADGSLAQGWKKIDGKWYYFYKGWPFMARNTTVWFEKGEDKYDIYGFNGSGAMIENAWFKEPDGGNGSGPWYYFGADGLAKKGWFQDKGKWYYLDPDYGYMWQWGFATMSDGNTYYLDKNTGAMKTGWLQDGDYWFFFKDSGAMAKKEWVKSGSKWYYLKEDGGMAANETLIIDGKEYKFDKDGAWIP